MPDYRAMDGVKTPYRWTVARPETVFTIQVEELKQKRAGGMMLSLFRLHHRRLLRLPRLN